MNYNQLWRMLEGESIDNKYYLKKFLGAGGYGGVFLADEVVDDDFSRQVAVKLISPDPELKKREEQRKELKNAVNLKHHNLLDCFVPGLCQIKGSDFLYLVMELAEGTLQERLQKSPLSETEVIEIVKAMASVLADLHNDKPQKVHRDVKPANILRVGNRWKLADLGLLTAIGSQSLNLTSNGRATPLYAPPEAYRGVVSPKWDVWSLGVMIVEMLTVQLPFTAETNEELMRQVMNDSPSIDWSKVPAPFVKIIEGCLEKDREKRWTAQRVIDRLPLFPTFTFETVTVNRQGGIIQRLTRQAQYFIENLGNNVAFEMVYIPGGKFLMGSPETEKDRFEEEGPQYEVTVKPFFMGKYPVTQAQYEVLMAENPSSFKGKNRPVERVSWDQAVEFCRRLSDLTGREYKLPSEAQWEYAARAGTTTPFYYGETITNELANYDGNYIYAQEPKGQYKEQTTDIGDFPPNAFGLYDIHGNVWEWCEDSWHDNYEGTPTDGVAGISLNGRYRALRGGSWYNVPSYCRVAKRNYHDRAGIANDFGFRVCCSHT